MIEKWAEQKFDSHAWLWPTNTSIHKALHVKTFWELSFCTRWHCNGVFAIRHSFEGRQKAKVCNEKVLQFGSLENASVDFKLKEKRFEQKNDLKTNWEKKRFLNFLWKSFDFIFQIDLFWFKKKAFSNPSCFNFRIYNSRRLIILMATISKWNGFGKKLHKKKNVYFEKRAGKQK